MTRKSKKHARRRARECALSVLYSGDIMEADAADIVEAGAYPVPELTMSDYAESLIEGVAAHKEDIDAHIAASAENWTLERMPLVDRAILRLATYEMLYVEDVPVSVSINEAVELAKAYGGEDDSSRFVNGVLGRIARASEESTGLPEATGTVEAQEAADSEEAVEDGHGDAASKPADGEPETATPPTDAAPAPEDNATLPDLDEEVAHG